MSERLCRIVAFLRSNPNVLVKSGEIKGEDYEENSGKCRNMAVERIRSKKRGVAVSERIL